MAAPKSSIGALLLLLVTVISVQSQVGDAQNCSTQLSNLNACSPFLVPGNPNPNPNADCCNALQAVQHDCICNTIQIANRIPMQCNLPPLRCPAFLPPNCTLICNKTEAPHVN
ncbi:hypothetical protein K2173_008709 [Erythroxylum novogranatense]|uniref:Bifunctional inhibitor/plant lipid transfer protein/seed storage helical domain-containing protein n=1 Tax=Erythroxylum novogranatense TaxID=1862640 RepID=A0AAV8SLU3_9ROSI|nr:hypothetical protein K2173_008709 [Erythroxylum novogranatense]